MNSTETSILNYIEGALRSLKLDGGHCKYISIINGFKMTISDEAIALYDGSFEKEDLVLYFNRSLLQLSQIVELIAEVVEE